MRPTTLLPLLVACHGSASQDTSSATRPLPADVIASFDYARVKADVDELADDRYAGRTPDTATSKLARDYIINEMEEIGLEPFGADGGYEHTFPMTLDSARYTFDDDGAVVAVDATVGTNVIGVLPGTDPALSDEYLLLTAHYDHLGVSPAGDVYNGAFDDITGTAALLEIARVLSQSEVALGRSILFLISDGEEGGLLGARGWTEDPTVPLSDIALALAVDPLGRAMLPDYWPIILLGLERSPDLKAAVREAAAWSDVDVTFVNRAPIPVFGADQDAFWELEEDIAAGWFVSPGMSFYHTVDDNPDTIDYRTVQDHGRFLLQLAAWAANDPTRYSDSGPQALTVEDARDAATLMEGVLGSSELSADERSTAEDLRDTLADIADRGDSAALDELSSTYITAAFFLLFTLTESHPGPVPPPLPE